MTYDDRQLGEIAHAMLYAKHFKHETDEHNRLLLIAKMAEELGFYMNGVILYRNEKQVRGDKAE